MAAASCPEPAWHTAETRPPIPENLKKADHVFIRHGTRRTPLDRPYDGPFRVIKREEKFFVLKVGSKEQTVSVDRLKPAFGFADPAPAISVPKGGGTIVPKTMPKTKKTLTPAAEVFCPGYKGQGVLTGRDQVEIRPCQPAPRKTGKLNRQFLSATLRHTKCLLCDAKSS